MRKETSNENLRSILHIGNRQHMLWVDPVEGEADHPMVKISFVRPLAIMDLTAHTVTELVMFRDFLNDAIGVGLDVARELDAIAAAADESGEGHKYKRLWRPQPVRHDFP